MILSSSVPVLETPWLIGTSAAAVLVYLGVLWRHVGPRAAVALWVAWAIHGASIILDTLGLGALTGGARFGFAPALSMTSWLVLAVYLVESRSLPLGDMRRALAAVCLSAVVLAACFPGVLHPKVVSPWAPLHWILGIASYGLFGVAVLHAAMLSAAERQLRAKRSGQLIHPEGGEGTTGVPVMRLERMTFSFVRAGFVVLTLAIVLGAAFARPWRWDHKAVFSLSSWIVFAGLLVGRHHFGWRGRKASRWLYGGTALLLLAYVGFRFVWEVLLGRQMGY